MAVGHANEPVMLAQLANVLREEANADIALTALGEVGLVVQENREWLGTSPDSVCLLVDSLSPIVDEFLSQSEQTSPDTQLMAPFGARCQNLLSDANDYYSSADISALHRG